MSKIKIAVKGNRAALIGNVDLIAGTIGQTCTFYFDERWNALPNKKVTYKIGPSILGTYEIKDNEVIIPSNVLAAAGLPLEIGVTGYSADKTTTIPTSWCLIGTIKYGAVACTHSSSDDYDDVIYDGGTVGPEEDDDQHIIYDGGVIS